MSPTKPGEELYDTENDPHEINNLADSPEHRQILEQLRAKLFAWMIETRDTSLFSEPDMHRRLAADLVGRKDSTTEQFIANLMSDDSAVRYWGAVGLTCIKGDLEKQAKGQPLPLRTMGPAIRARTDRGQITVV